MREGLKAASEERCDALKNEYPELRPFFEGMRDKRSQFNDGDLKPLWKQHAADKWLYEKFVNHLEAIGLLARRDDKGKKKYKYAVASLYIDGLGVIRVQGETM
jgi:hypothetical protein